MNIITIDVIMFKLLSIIFFCAGVSLALPADPILRKLDNLRYQYAPDSNGDNHLVDLWMSLSDVDTAARYNPSASNIYHLFTRRNNRVSHPLLPNDQELLSQSNYDSSKRTVVLIHGWMNSPTSEFNSVLLPALLGAEDLNVIVVDWSSGAFEIQYSVANANAVKSGAAVAEFINWLNQASGSVLGQYYIIGHGIGGHQAGIVGRNLEGKVAYITGLDPAFIGWSSNEDKFKPNDAFYTEVIHTNYGVFGYIADLAQVDFYPNGGISMPGCDSNACDHARSFHYLAESFTSGGFTGRRCWNYYTAILNSCTSAKQIPMGGLYPKTWQTGVYLLETNASPPFSQG